MNNKTVVVISTYILLINQRLYFKSLFGLSTTLDNSSYNFEFGIFFFLHYFLSFSLIVWCIMCPRIRSDQMYMRLKGSDLDQMINVELKGVWGNVISAGQGGLDCAERCQKWDEQILTGLSTCHTSCQLNHFSCHYFGHQIILVCSPLFIKLFILRLWKGLKKSFLVIALQ